MDRRKFIGTGSAALAILALPKALRAQPCPTSTTADRYGYGPYYIDGAPTRAKLAGSTEPGKKMSIDGVVTNCSGPVKGVTLEVWQATAAGCYIHPSQPECPDGGNPQVSRLWAKLVTNEKGAFAFDTVQPGVYLNGAKYRPSHIHFRIRSPQGSADPLDLVTQLYFEGDQYIAGDYGADEPGAKPRTIALKSAAGVLMGNFPVHIPGGTTALGGRIDPLSDPALDTFDAFVQRAGDRFRVFLPPVPAGQPVEARLYDGNGVLFRRSLHTSLPLEFDAALWPRGNYQAEFRWHTDKGPRSEAVSLRK